MTPAIYCTPVRALNADQIAAWTRLCHTSGLLVSPFLRPEFAQAVAEVRDNIEVAIVEHADEPVAFLPFRRTSWNTARPAGGWLASFQAIVAAENLDIDPVALLRSCHLQSWRFDHLLRPALGLTPHIRRVWESPYADLTGGYEAYCQRLKSNRSRLTEFARLRRKLARDVGEVRFEPHVSSLDILQMLCDWKGAQYQRTGERNIFAAPWVRRLLERLLDCRDQDFSSALSVLYAGERMAAIAFWLRSRSNLHGWITAYDRELANYSPGINLMLDYFQAAESVGVRRVELGKGPEQYKRRFMTGVTPVYEGAIDAGRIASLTRRCWWSTKDWLDNSGLTEPARRSIKFVRGVRGWIEMG